MTFLLLAILFNALIGLVFRYFSQWNVDTFPAIVLNYWTCVLIGVVLNGSALLDPALLEADWMPFAWGIGAVFILGFQVIAITVKFFGMTFTTLMQKISLVLTAIFGITVFGESAGILKWMGIILAVPAIYLLNKKPKKSTLANQPESLPPWTYLLPAMTLLINATLDSLFLSLEALNLYSGTDLRLVTFLFAIAALIGTVILLFRLRSGKAILSTREVKSGVLLGAVNYGSIFFILKALNEGWEGSAFYPIVNVGIIGATAILGWFVFRENLTPLKWLGFIIAIIAIGFISAA